MRIDVVNAEWMQKAASQDRHPDAPPRIRGPVSHAGCEIRRCHSGEYDEGKPPWERCQGHA